MNKATHSSRSSEPSVPESLQLAARLGHVFANPHLLQQALTHRSFSADHNERLEFLGDSVLNLAVSSLLFGRLRQAPEGDLSRIRANLVRQESLHQIALRLDLPSALKLGEGELRSGGLNRPSILADALEALLGAVYLDAGYVVAESLVHRLFAEVDLSAQAPAGGKDAKTALQEWLHARKYAVPQYRVTDVGGQAHRQTFWVECEVQALGIRQSGSGASRRAAEQDAASKVLEQLQATETPLRPARKEAGGKYKKPLADKPFPAKN